MNNNLMQLTVWQEPYYPVATVSGDMRYDLYLDKLKAQFRKHGRMAEVRKNKKLISLHVDKVAG